jgi:hypothetical protein
MRSFAVFAGLAAAANAAAVYPPTYNTTSVAPPTYETSEAPAYPAYPVSSKAPEYPSYPVSSQPAEYYPEQPYYTTTKVLYGLTTYCPEPTTVVYGKKTYTVKTATTIIDDDCEYTTTYVVKPTPTPVKPTYAPPVYSSQPPAVYPSKNATAPVYPTGVKPSSTKPATPEFTGAAAQAGVGLMAVIGAVAAFL